MTSNPLSTHICPWLGSEIDRTTRYGYPSTANVCFSPQALASLTTLHQEQWCLSGKHGGCPHYQDPPVNGFPAALVQPPPAMTSSRHRRVPTSWIGIALGALTLVMILLGLLVQFAGRTPASAVVGVKTPSVASVTETVSEIFQATETPGVTPTSVATASPIPSSPTRTPSPNPTSTSIVSTEQPKPTLTPLPGTPTVTQLPFVAPRLLSPITGSTVIAGTQVELKWESAGELRPDELYDVQIWKDNETPHGIAWSKENRWMMPANFPPGKYQWRIVVIQGKDGKWIANLSPASETWALNRQ